MAYRKALVAATVTVGDVYTVGDVVGGLLSFDLIDNKATGQITQITVIDRNTSKLTPFRLFFFDEAPASFGDHTPFLPETADMNLLIGFVDIGADEYQEAGERSYVRVRNLGQRLEFELSGTILYMYAVCLGSTPTYETTNDLSFKIGVQLDT